ncbi:hypothetical protein MMC30_000568, partial [Trapelia coarctata]|nr:hypothetical protein [Trapelia coarctata]
LGCEKIQGFTYSGGLLRHQREVHKQHGGPKAPRMCPHRDCKRSTGTGFSRKENLNEHLRRVHRGVGIGASDVLVEPAVSTSASASAPEQARRQSHETLEQTQVQGRRKRAKEVDADEEVDEMREESVQSLVKRLRKVIEDKDARIHMLEMMVQNLITHQPQHQRNTC